MRRIVLYSAVNALIVVMALCFLSAPARAQECRRSCKAGEERDARGCCIPSKSEQQKKKEQEQKAEQQRKARKEKAEAERRKRAEAERRKKEQEERAAREERARKRQGGEASQTTGAGDKREDTREPEGTAPATGPAVKPRDRKSRDRGRADKKPVDRETPESSSSAELDSIPVPEAGEGALQQRWETWIPWSVVGAGAALFATGGVLEWRAVANGNSFDRAFAQLCGTIGCFESESEPINERLERAELQQRLGIAFFITGGAAIATGLTLVYLNRPTMATGLTGESPSNVSLVPMVSPSATGMSVDIRF